jgi:hypothetical protein
LLVEKDDEEKSVQLWTARCNANDMRQHQQSNITTTTTWICVCKHHNEVENRKLQQRK